MRHALLVGLTALIAMLVAGCGGKATPPGGYTMAQLQQVPEERLFYPGSTVIGQFGGDGLVTITGPQPSIAGYTLASQDPASEIIDFYAQQLQARGWQPYELGRGTNELRAVGWTKGTLVFRLAILRPGDVRNPTAVDAYLTAYEIAVFVPKENLVRPHPTP